MNGLVKETGGQGSVLTNHTTPSTVSQRREFFTQSHTLANPREKRLHAGELEFTYNLAGRAEL